MSLFGSSIGMVVVFLIAVTGLIVASFAVHRAYHPVNSGTTLVDPKLQQPLTVGGVPTVAVGTAGSVFTLPTITAGSNDASGSISGTIIDASTFAILNVTFSKAYPTAPNSVHITPVNQAAAAQRVFVLSVSTTGFQLSVNGTNSGGGSTGAQYYYLVL